MKLEVDIIRARKVFYLTFFLSLFTLLLLFVVIFAEDWLNTNNLDQLLFQRILFGGFIVLLVISRVIRRFDSIGKILIDEMVCEVQLPNEIIEIPTSEVTLKIDSYKDEPITGIRNLHWYFWESGDGNYLKFTQEAKQRKVELLISDKATFNGLKKLRTTRA